jgi:hypothetical protein
MIGPFVFLDIDGVLNHHVQHDNGYCGICKDCMATFNGILDATGAQVVVASAWRYFCLRNEMSIQGFQGMMCTHGLKWGCIVDVLRKDDDRRKDDRGKLVEYWFQDRYGLVHPTQYVVLDDMDLGYSDRGLNFVRVNNGLCKNEGTVEAVLGILKQPTHRSVEQKVGAG